jgi:hypothetical protein
MTKTALKDADHDVNFMIGAGVGRARERAARRERITVGGWPS